MPAIEPDENDYNARAEIRRHWAVFLGLAIGLAIWCAVDVARRARVDPQRPALHMTDFTVYTEAGAAFFDGREPYEVCNVRGWKYLYPPLFALMVAPLHVLPTPLQATVWFSLSALMAFGCYFECRRLVAGLYARSHATRANASLDALRRAPVALDKWLVATALAATVFPALNCLQRGQMGVALLYFLLVGFRLATAGNTVWWKFAGGILLALPVALKLTPALPAVALLVGLLIVAWRSQLARPVAATTGVARAAWREFFIPTSGFVAGGALFLLLIPAALVGWKANLDHLHTWYNKVVRRVDDVRTIDFAENVASCRNQSLHNAMYRGGNWAAHQFFGGPVDIGVDVTRGNMPMEAPLAKHAVNCIRVLALTALAIVVVVAAQRRDPLLPGAAFGLALVATLVVSPVSRGHYFVFWAPAVVFVPLRLLQLGKLRAAWQMALAPAILTLLHYSHVDSFGRIGLLGLGTTAWFFVACGQICVPGRPRQAAASVDSTAPAASLSAAA